MSFQMRSMRSRASRVTNTMTSFWRSDALVARKNTSVPKNTTNWPTAGVIAASAAPTISAGLASTETVCPVAAAGMIAFLMSCSTAIG